MKSDMINVDISNVWGDISLGDLLGMEREVFDAHMALTEGTGAGIQFRGWLDLPEQMQGEPAERILAAAEKIRSESEVCVVVGIGGSCLGARGAIELLQGPSRNMGKGLGDPQVCFAGNNLSTRCWNELVKLLEGKDFSVIVIAESGDAPEPAIALRGLRWMMERKYGTDEANSRIYVVAAPEESLLHRMAAEQGWESFDVPASVGRQYGVLSAAGLLPMAVAGIDIRAVIAGALENREAYDLRSFENPVWLYAAVRNALYRQRKELEILAGFEPGFRSFGRWWQQLFSASEGKNGVGLFPVCAEFTEDLYSLGQTIRDGRRNLFETAVRFLPPEEKTAILADAQNSDGLNCLAGQTLDFVEEMAWEAALENHVDGGVSVITVDCGELNPATVGELFRFLELSCGISACVLGVNSFDQPGVDSYRKNVRGLLGILKCEE